MITFVTNLLGDTGVLDLESRVQHDRNPYLRPSIPCDGCLNYKTSKKVSFMISTFKKVPLSYQLLFVRAHVRLLLFR